MPSKVDVEDQGHVQFLREIGSPVYSRARGFSYERDAPEVHDGGPGEGCSGRVPSCERYAPEVHEGGPGEDFSGNVLRAEKLVGGRIGSIEGERAVSVRSYLHEGERSTRGRFTATDRRGIYTLGLQVAQDKIPEEILPDAPDERRLRPEPCGGHGDVRGRPARPGGGGGLGLGRAPGPVAGRAP